MKLGLIGYPLGHSKSPEIFAQIFKEHNIEGDYSLFTLEDVKKLRSWLSKHPKLQGFNVTIPHKQSIIPLLNSVSPEVQAIGAVNTVKITKQEGELHLEGFNTDYFGFKTSLQKFIGETTLKALVLGTGGSSKAVCYALESLGIDFTQVSRTKRYGVLSYSDLSGAIIEAHKLIINTTPLGMQPNVENFPALPYEALTAKHFLYDLVYNPTQTLFLAKGEQQGAKTKNGLEMLQLQARKAWEIWNR